MQKVDKILLGTLIPLIAGVVVTAVVLAVVYRVCPAGQMWDLSLRVCRAKCPGESTSHGQRYNGKKGVCECPSAAAPHWDAHAQECVGICDPGDTWNRETQMCDPAKLPTCTPLPSVNEESGEVENATHFPRGARNCGEGTVEELTALCTASTCSATDAGCSAGDTWDGYDRSKKRCVKRVNCAAQPCDAKYCTTDTVKRLVGPVQKVQQGDVCTNPPASVVGALCNAVPSSKWVNPNCLSLVPSPDAAVQVSVTSATVADGIAGKVSNPLINGVVDVGANGFLTYRYTLVPRQASAAALLGVAEQVLPLTSLCGAVTDAPTDVCANFLITVPADTRPGEYLLSVTGYPAWDSTLPLYPAGTPTVVMLRPSSSDATVVLPAVTFNTSLARTLAADKQLVDAGLTALAQRYPGSVTPTATGLVVPPATEGEDTTMPLIVPCSSSYCTVNEAVAYKLVVLAWYPLPPPAPGVCKSGESLVRYTLTRSVRTSSTPQVDGCTVSDGVQDCVLIGPTRGQNQPSEAEVQTGHLMFLDLVPAGVSVTYNLGAYLVDTPNSTTQYEYAQCRSPLFQVGLTVPPYSNKECATLPVPGKLPPYMSMNNGMCNWDGSPTAADFYCYFYHPRQEPHERYLAHDGRCERLVRGPVSLKHTWTTSSCPNCRDGEEQTETVKCPDYVKLEHVATKLDSTLWMERLGDMASAFGKYNVDPGAHAADTGIETPEQRAALFQTYTQCGPLLSPSGYGSSGVKACAVGDTTCTAMATNASCGVGQNVCGSWESAGKDADDESPQFARTRQCYNWPEVGKEKSACCSGKGTYKLVAQPGGKKVGLCNCPPQTWGDYCEYDPCEATFGVGQPQCQLRNDPSKTGVCFATGPLNDNYYCEPQYFALETDGYYEFRGPGHKDKPQVEKYRVIQLGRSFTTVHDYAVIAESAGWPDQIRVEIGKGDNKDEVIAQLVLYEGTLSSDYTRDKTVSTLPANALAALPRDANRLVEREHDGYIPVNNFWACTKANTAYTLAILLTFPQKTGTDDLVRVHYPYRMVVRTTSNLQNEPAQVQSQCTPKR